METIGGIALKKKLEDKLSGSLVSIKRKKNLKNLRPLEGLFIKGIRSSVGRAPALQKQDVRVRVSYSPLLNNSVDNGV